MEQRAHRFELRRRRVHVGVGIVQRRLEAEKIGVPPRFLGTAPAGLAASPLLALHAAPPVPVEAPDRTAETLSSSSSIANGLVM